MDDMVCAFLWMAMLAYVICFAYATLALANRAYLDGYDIIVEDVESI